MLTHLLLCAAVPVSLAAVFALALWCGGIYDRAANAAAGFTTYDLPPYAPWTDQDGDTPCP